MIHNKKPIIAGNWKMNGLLKDADNAERIALHPLAHKVKLCLFPPVTLLHSLGQRLKALPIELGAQDCAAEAIGAFTGDIAATMIKDLGCTCVLLGHSERRHGRNESSNLTASKVLRAIEANLTPIICIGETLDQRQSGQTFEILKQQIHESLPLALKTYRFALAYEPVWAIGTGLAASNEDIESAISFISDEIENHLGLGADDAIPPILYGGSVKADNAKSILMIKNVGGLLVGGASLNYDGFSPIIEIGASLDQ